MKQGKALALARGKGARLLVARWKAAGGGAPSLVGARGAVGKGRRDGWKTWGGQQG